MDISFQNNIIDLDPSSRIEIFVIVLEATGKMALDLCDCFGNEIPFYS